MAEAQSLAVAICNYARHTSYRMDPRTRDLLALLLTVAAIEGPRLIRASTRRTAQAAAAKVAKSQADQSTAGRVVQWPQGAAPA